jgi:hypothetical protein
LEFSESDRAVFERRVRDRRGVGSGRATDTNCVVAHPGLTGPQIAARVGCTDPTVVLWRGRFAEDGLAGLEDRARKPPPRTTVTDGVRDEILTATLTLPPRWS